MKKNLLLLIGLVFVCLSNAYAQQPPPYDYKVNRLLATPITAQPNGVPAYGAITQYGEVLTAPKPGNVACTAAVTDTTATNIIAGASGLGHIVTSIWCHNVSSTGSIVTIKNDGTSVGSTYLSTTAIGDNTRIIDFKNPIYVNPGKALTMTMTTTSTSTVCCANYLNDINSTPTSVPTNTPTNTPTLTPTRTPTLTPTP